MNRCFIFIIGLTCLFLNLHAQRETKEPSEERELLAKSDSLLAIGIELYEAERYKEAIYALDECHRLGTASGADGERQADLLYYLASCHHGLGGHDKAVELCERALEVWGDIYGTEHPNYAKALGKLGAIKSSLALYEESENLCKRALEIYEKTLGKEQTDYADVLSTLAGIKLFIGEAEGAVALGEEALSIYEMACGRDHKDYASALGNLGTIYGATGDTEKGIKFLTEALPIMEATLGVTCNSYVNGLAFLMSFNNESGNADEALGYGEKALSICKESDNIEKGLYGSILCEVSLIHYLKGNYASALEYSKEGISQGESRYRADCCFIAAMSHIYLGESDEAGPLLEEYFASIESKSGKLSQEYLSEAIGVSDMLIQAQCFAQAGRWRAEALAIIEQTAGKGNMAYAESLVIVGTCKTRAQDIDGGQKNITEALSIMECLPDTIVPLSTVAVAKMVLAGCHAVRGEWGQVELLASEALGLMNESDSYYAECRHLLEISKQVNNQTGETNIYDLSLASEALKRTGEQSIEYANLLKRLAEAEITNQNYDNAIEYIERALNIVGEISGYSSRDYALMLTTKATCHSIMGNHWDAWSCQLSAMGIYEDLGMTESIEYMLCVRLYVMYCTSIGLGTTDVIHYASMAASWIKALHGEDSAEYAQALNRLCLIYDRSGQYGEAVNTGTQVVDIFEKVYGTQSVDYAIALGNLSTYYSSAGQQEEAAKLNKKAMAIHKSVSGKEAINYVISLRNQADYSAKQNDLKQAIKQMSDAIEIGENLYGKESDDYANMLSSLASYYANAGDYAEAIKIEKEAGAIFETLHGRDAVYYATSIHSLAGYHSESGDFNEALQLYQAELPLRQQIFGDKSSAYARVLSAIADCHYNLENSREAVEVERQANEIYKAEYSEEGGAYIESLNNLATYYSDIDNPEEAIRLAEIVLQQRKKVYGENHYLYAAALHRMAGFYDDAVDYDRAIELEKQALDIIATNWDKDDPGYANILNMLALYYSHKGLLYQAIQSGEEACRIYKKFYGKADPDYANSLHNLASFYSELGYTNKAIKAATEALEIKQRIYGEREFYFDDTMGNLAIYYDDLGDQEEALKYGLEVLRIRETKYGKLHRDYALALSNIASIYSSMGLYAQAIRASEEAIDIYEQTLGTNHPHLATALSNLAGYYAKIGNHALAEKHETRALEIRKVTLGANHPNYAISLMGMATMLKSFDKDDRALELYSQALDIYQSFYGRNCDGVAEALSNMAEIYSDKGDHDKAMKCAEEAFKIEKKQKGNDNPSLVRTLQTLSSISFTGGNYKEAAKYEEEAMEIRTACYGIEHPNNATSWRRLAWNYLFLKDTPMLQNATTQATALMTSTVMSTFVDLTTYERQLFWDDSGPWFENTSHFFAYVHPSEATVASGYDCALVYKGLLLNSEIAFSNLIQESGDTAAITLYNNLKWLRGEIRKLQDKPVEERYADVDSLSEVASQMEKELLAMSKSYGDFTKNLAITWQQVRDNLGEKETAIEFVSFHHADGTVVYIAYVLRSDYHTPKMITLFNNRQLEAIDRSDYYTTDSLANLVWKPLADALEGVETVYFSPSGELYNIAIESVPSWEDGGKSLVSDKRNFFRLSSTRGLALIKDENSWEEAAVYGGLQYDMSVSKMVDIDKQYPKQRGGADLSFIVTSDDDASRDDRDVYQGLPYLKGTKVEAMAVKNRMDADNVPVRLFTDSIGTEASFKALSGKKTSIIHIGTHGFFNKKVKKYDEKGLLTFGLDNQKKVIEDAALTNSGLYFAGADNALMDKDAIPDGIDDGKLTALEIAQLDLRGLDLVVLSACQTGLGEITGDGVFGLQRGFKKAGAQTIVMSLWKVDDDATTEFMTTFFKNIEIDSNGHPTNKQQAFRDAQKHLRTMNGGKYDDPKYWAAFVMLDGIK